MLVTVLKPLILLNSLKEIGKQSTLLLFKLYMLMDQLFMLVILIQQIMVLLFQLLLLILKETAMMMLSLIYQL